LIDFFLKQKPHTVKKIFTLVGLTVITVFSPAQQRSWVDVWQNSNNFYEIRNAFNDAFRGIDLSTVKGWKPYKRWEWYHESRTYPSGDLSGYRQSLINYRNFVQANPEAVSARTSTANWQFIGPNFVPTSGGGAGRINNVRLVPGSTSQFVIAAPGGGVWKYDGSNWTTSTDYLNRIGFADVAIDYNNTNIIYAASGDNDGGDTPGIGIFKSTNGGTSWSISGLTSVTRFYRLIMHPTNPGTLLVSTNSGIYRTTDGAANWTQVSTETNIRDMEFKPGDPNTIFASKMSSATILFRSTDGGASFSSSGVGSGLPNTGNGRAMIAVTPHDANYIYMIVGNSSDNGFKGVYRSIDGGVNWVARATSPNLLGWSSTGSDSGGQQWYDLAIAVSPTDKDLVITGGVNVWRSTNGGTTWQIAGHWTGSGAPYIHADIHDLNFDANGVTVYAGCDGGIFKKDDITNSLPWTDLSNGLAIAQMYRMGQSTQSQNKVISGWQDNGTNLWTGPNTWQRVIGGDGMECLIDYSSDTYQYGELYYGNIRRSTNGGASFSTIVGSGGTAGTVGEDGDWVTPYVINPRNPQSLYVGKSRIYKSVNRGTNWVAHPAFGSGNIDAIAIAPSDTNYIYASKSSQIWRSTNDGQSYTDITAGLPGLFITYIAVDEANPSKLFVTLSGTSASNKVFMSTNAGASWTNITTGLPNLSCNTIVLDTLSNLNAMYVGMDAGIYYRDDNSSGWTAFNTNLPNVEITELEIQYAAQKIRASTYGRGLWESNLESGSGNFLNAAFTSNGTSICRGASIQYSDQSTGTPAPNFWSWSFPGGTPANSNLRNPIVAYNSNGIYPVTLTVGNGVTFHTVTLNNYVTVTSVTPLISIVGDLEICAGGAANYTATGSNLGNPTYTWKVNGIATGSNSSQFSSGSLTNGSVILCEVVSTAACAQPATATSNTITLNVKPVPPKPVITAVYGLLTSSNPTGNQWMLNGVDIAGATGVTYNAIKDGKYSVRTTINGCTSPASDDVNVKIEGLFKVYPVPNPGDLNVVFFVPTTATKYSLSIHSATGQLVHKESGIASPGVLVRNIDVRKLNSGIYHVRISTGKQEYKKAFSKITR
jgi:PKD repeat protein